MASRQPAGAGASATPTAPGAHPQYSLPKYSPEELCVQKKQAEEIQKDVRHFVQMDTAAPFANLQDAAVRLLPFHLFNAADPAAADLDDTPDHMGADLMASRQEAWEELCIAKANDLRRRAEAHSKSIADLEARMAQEALSGTRSIDHYAVAKVQQEDLKQKIAADKALLTKLTPPAPAVVPAAAAGAAGRGAQAGAGAGAGLLGIAGSQAMQPGVAAAAAAAKAAGRMQPQVMLPNAALTMLQAQQIAAVQQGMLAQLPPAQQQHFMVQQLLLRQAQQQQQQQQQQPLQAQQQMAQLAALQQQQMAQLAQAAQMQQLLAAHKKQ